MTDHVVAGALGLLPALCGGSLLGAAFYGSLWWTVRRGLQSSRPVVWFVVGMALRTCVALAGIHLIGDGRWQRIATCLLGFAVARPLVAWLTRPATIRLDGQRS